MPVVCFVNPEKNEGSNVGVPRMKSKLHFIVIPAVYFTLCISQMSIAKYGGGSGTFADPYQIRTPQQMNTIGINTEDMGKHFKLMSDIDMSAYTGVQYHVIGDVMNKFTGSFDGDGHVISNLTYVTTSAYYDIGVFGRIAGATIKNLGARNVTISSNGDWIGGLVGRSDNGTVVNCFTSGSVTGQYGAGGLVGSNQGWIINCYSGCSTTTTDTISKAAGLAATNDGSIANCYATGLVKGKNTVLSGGLVGMGNGSVAASFWDTQTTGKSESVGGTGKNTAEMKTLETFTSADWDFTDTDGDAADWWMPSNSYPRLAWEYPYGPGSGTPEDPYQIWTPQQMNAIGLNPADWNKQFLLMADLDMSIFTGTQYRIIGNGTTPFSGSLDGNGHVIRNLTFMTASDVDYVGLFGQIVNATIQNLGLDNVLLSTGGSWIGGLAGVKKGGIVTACYVTGSVSGDRIGGFVGYHYLGVIENCYASCLVTGTTTSYVGGLVGYNDIASSITDCYATGWVSGGGSIGGLLGFSHPDSPIIACFWDTQTSGRTTSAGGTGKTTAEMKTLSTFATAGWDCVDLWGIGNRQTYPYLKYLTGFYPADINLSGTVDMEDLATVAANWLRQ